MSLAPYFNDRRNADQPLVLGCFRECDHGHLFEFAERGNLFPADFHPEMPHVIFVGHDQTRLAHVKKTVLTMVDGEEQLQKWMIKGQREYAK